MPERPAGHSAMHAAMPSPQRLVVQPHCQHPWALQHVSHASQHTRCCVTPPTQQQQHTAWAPSPDRRADRRAAHGVRVSCRAQPPNQQPPPTDGEQARVSQPLHQQQQQQASSNEQPQQQPPAAAAMQQQAAHTQQQPSPPPLPQQRKRRSSKRRGQASPLAPLLRALQALVAALLRVRLPAPLASFLLGGWAAALLLYGWAKGSPLRRSAPYRFNMTFTEASKVGAGTPVRMKGVVIGNVVSVALSPSGVHARAEVADAANVIPQGSRVDINLLGLAADPWIDITPPLAGAAAVRRGHGPHHPACRSEGLIVCHDGHISGQQGGSTDFMMKFFLSQHDRTRVKTADTLYHGKTV